MSILDPLPDDSPWYRDHKFLAGKVYEMATRISELTTERNALAARLAAAEKVIKTAEQWRNEIIRGATAVTFDEINLEAALENKLIAAVDAYHTYESEETHHG